MYRVPNFETVRSKVEQWYAIDQSSHLVPRWTSAASLSLVIWIWPLEKSPAHEERCGSWSCEQSINQTSRCRGERRCDTHVILISIHLHSRYIMATTNGQPASAQLKDDLVRTTVAHLKQLTVDRLKRVLKNEGLAVSGVKSELQRRLIQCMDSTSSTPVISNDNRRLHTWSKERFGTSSTYAECCQRILSRLECIFICSATSADQSISFTLLKPHSSFKCFTFKLLSFAFKSHPSSNLFTSHAWLWIVTKQYVRI